MNNKNRVKSRSSLERPHQNSSLQNMNSKPQMRQKPSNERPVTPEGVYFNARLMHCTTSLVGCVVQIQTKDGTRYEGILRTFSPEFELVVDYVTKIDNSSAPIGGSNIANLLVSLEAKNTVSPRLIFKFQDVVKLNATNVDLEFAANKGLLLTDSEISRNDSKHMSRDKDVKELVPWDGGHSELEETLDDCNGVETQNGWSPDEMFKVNEAKFQVKSTYDPSLPDYTCALNTGEGPEFEQKQRTAAELAQQIESDPSRIERYAREDADDEDKYSAVVRPNDRPNDSQHNRNQDRNRNRKSNNSPNSYSVNNNSGGSAAPPLPQRQTDRTDRRSNISNAGTASTPFHPNKNPNYKPYAGGNGGADRERGYSNQSSHKGQPYRDPDRDREHISSFPVQSQTYTKSGESEESSHPRSAQHRDSNDNRRPAAPNNKRKEDVTADLKKFSNDFKLPSNVSNADIPKEKEVSVSQKSESHSKHSNASGFSAKSKSATGAGDTIPVKDKSAESVGPQLETTPEKDKEVRDSSDQKDSNETSSVTPTPGSPQEPELAKKSTLNVNAKVFTPRSPMAPLTTSATPPSVSSTPSSTVSVPISSQMTHAGQQHSLSQGHSQQQSVGPQQSATHASQARFPNPLVQIPHQYNVLTPGLTPLLAHNQYLMTNVAAMPSFAPNNPNQQRNYRNKGPQQYSNVRHEFTQQNAHVAAAVTGHPVLAAAPIGAPQQVNYGQQQTMVQQSHPQHMYQHMYQFQPRMTLPQHQAMQMAVPQAVQYDPTQLQHIYTGAVQLQHLVSQAHQHMTNSGPHSGHSTPQSATPTTPLHGGPAPSPVHHQPNQPPTPTPQQQQVMYANVSSHNPQNSNVGHHQNSGPYHNIVILPTGQAMSAQHHSGGHGAQLHAAHLSHSTNANHSGGPTLLPVHLIASSNAQNQLAANFNTNSGV